MASKTVEDILAESEDDDLDDATAGLDINSILSAEADDEDDKPVKMVVSAPVHQPVVPSQAQTRPKPSEMAAAIIANSDDDSEDDLKEGSERYNQLLEDVLHEEEDSDDDTSAPIKTTTKSSTVSSNASSTAPTLPSAAPPVSTPAASAPPKRTSISAPATSTFTSSATTNSTAPVLTPPVPVDAVRKPSLIGQLAPKISVPVVVTAPKPRIEAEGQARLAAAAVYEEKLSRVGNFTMISPLQEKRKRSKNKAGQQVLKVMFRSQIKAELGKWKHHTGEPTAAVIHYKFIAIGTARGVILVFDHFESLVMALGKFEDTQGRGAVTALDMSPESDNLVAGHQKGQLVLWDLLTKTAHKVIADSSPSAVTQVRFTKRGKPQFAAVHLDGTLNVYTAEKMIFFSWQKQCLLYGKDSNVGPILACATLLPSPQAPHLCDSFSLLAFATTRDVAIVALEPQVRILFKIPCEGEHLTCLAWRGLRTQDKEKDADGRKQDLTSNPVLAIAQGTSIQLFIISPPDSPGSPEPLKLTEAGTFNLSKGNFTFLHWLGGQVIVAMTDQQEVKVIDPYELTELESREIKDIGLIYHEFFISPITNKPTLGYDNAIRGSDESLLLVGTDIVEAKVLSWSERVSALVEKSQWIDALALGLDFYEGVAKAAIGLPKNRKELRHKLADPIVQLLMSYVDLALGGRDKSSTGVRHVELIAGVAIDYCVIIERLDLLFRDIYLKFLQAGGEEVFLELLEPYILNDRISYLSPEVMKAFVEKYHKKGKLVQVEQCITHMDVAALDFRQVVGLCQQKHLFTALIYVYNKGLSDFASPFDDALRILTSGVALEQSREQVAFKMMLYVHCCLVGQGFPRGDIDPQKLPGVKAQILAAVFAEKDQSPENRYPWLRYMLHLDTEEFLATLALAFAAEDWRLFLEPEPVEPPPEPEVAAPAPVVQPKRDMQTVFGGFFKQEVKEAPQQPPPVSEGPKKKPGDGFAAQVRAMNIPSCQVMLDVLAWVFVDPSSDPFTSPSRPSGLPEVLLDRVATCKQLRTMDRLLVFFSFCAKILVQNKLLASKPLITQLFSFLTWPDGKNRPQRERDLMALLESTNEYDSEALLAQARSANFYDVCVYLYKKKGDYVRVFECYLKAAAENPSRVNPLFDYIPTLIPTQGKDVIKNAVLAKLPELINLNSDRTAKLMVECFGDENERIVKLLGKDKRMQFNYLKSVMATRHTLRIDVDDETNPSVTVELHELYISLLCEFAPTDVYAYISTHEDYNIDNALKLCQKFGVNDAAAYLLERTGDVQAALGLILQTIDAAFKVLQEHISKNWREEVVAPKALQPMQNTLSVAIMLCERSLESEPLWFELLDRFFKMQRAITEEQRRRADSIENQRTFHLLEQSVFSFVRTVLASMMNHVPFAVILRKITTDHQSNPFREFRETIQSMLDSYSYEQNILKTANHLLAGDIYCSIRHLHQSQARAFRTLTNSCGACGLDLTDLTSTKVVLYDCGHAFHVACCGRGSTQCPLCGRSSNSKKEKGVHVVKPPDKEKGTPRGQSEIKTFDKSVTSVTCMDRLQAADRINYPLEQEGLSRFEGLLHRGGAGQWGVQLRLAPQEGKR